MPLTKVQPIPDPPTVKTADEECRLWIGNLDTTISEYHLLKILQKYGCMEKFDMLYHRSGPLSGQPRGYAFVTYSSNAEAEKMRKLMDRKKIGTKHIAVRWAHNLNMEEQNKNKLDLEIPALTGGKPKENISRISKIQAIEAKLKIMQNSTNSEFQLNEGPSGVSLLNQPRPRRVSINSKSSNKTKSLPNRTRSFSKPYQRRM